MKKKKIVFDATVLANGLHKNSGRSGIFLASFEIFKAMRRRNDIEITLFAMPSSVDGVNAFMESCFPGAGLKAANRRRSSLPGRFREYIERRKERCPGSARQRLFVLRCFGAMAKIAAILTDKFAGCGKIDLRNCEGFFSPVYLPPKSIRKNGVKRFTVLYDTIPVLYRQFSPFTMLGFSWNFDLIKHLGSDDRGFAISECTKRDFLRFSPELKTENVDVIPLAASENFRPCREPERISCVRRKYGIPDGRRYILSLCTIEPRKNLIFAVRAFSSCIENEKIDDLVFVLAGGHWARFESRWQAALQEMPEVRDKLILAGYVDDEDLSPLYSGADMFIYPSLYEGFGLPPLEAMQCGCPVIVSDRASLPEVVGDAGIMIDPENEEEAAAAIAGLYADPSRREELQRLGLERAKVFSWDKCAGIIAEAIGRQ